MDEAISQYQEAIRLKPDDADAHHINLGIALARKAGPTKRLANTRKPSASSRMTPTRKRTWRWLWN